MASLEPGLLVPEVERGIHEQREAELARDRL
jgi:hypothetical protein